MPCERGLSSAGMKAPTARRTLWLFVALSIYIAAQSIWWAVLLLRRDAEITELRSATEMSSNAGDPTRRVLMVFGEAGVFLLIVLALLLLVYRSVRRDLRMAGAQRNFLLAVTHELRSPIAAIKLQLHTLARPGLDPGQRAQLEKNAVEEADRLALLTDKVLLATTADEASFRVRPQLTDVIALVHGVAERARANYARAHQIQVVAPGTFMATTDPQALRSILENLLENATKYSPQGGAIVAEVRTGQGSWQLIVTDEGPGVPLGERELVFERFHRSGSEEVRATTGTGLGLYIVQRLVQRLGGRIEIGDHPPHGAIFTATFPER